VHIANGVDFHGSIEAILHVAGKTESLCVVFDEIAKPNALHPATNDVPSSLFGVRIRVRQNWGILTR